MDSTALISGLIDAVSVPSEAQSGAYLCFAAFITHPPD
jgi:hypothetical protein